MDTSLSWKNERLIDRGRTAEEVNKYRKNFEKEIFKYNRKNLVHAVEVCIQCPSDCPPDQEDAFFKESYNYIVSKLPAGEKCVFVAEIHRDEHHFVTTIENGIEVTKDISKAHLHIAYVPAVPDLKHDGYEYKLCADQLTKRAILKEMHPQLQFHLDSKGIQATVFHKKDSGGKTISLSVNQLKEITAKTGIVIDHSLTVDELANIISQNASYKQDIESLSSIVQEQRKEICLLQDKIKVLEEKTYTTDKSQQHTWGTDSGWGSLAGWGKSSTSTHTIDT